MRHLLTFLFIKLNLFLLPIALLAAIKIEVHDIEEASFEKEQDKPVYAQDEDSGLMTEQAQMESESKRCHHLCPQQRKSSSIPLLLLVKQILKNECALITTAIVLSFFGSIQEFSTPYYIGESLSAMEK